MKTRNAKKFDAPKSREGGMVTLLFIGLLAIMMVLVATNVRTLVHLRAEENLIEKKQIERLHLSQANAAAVPPANQQTK
jgi:Na+(H+)/acetate symporter ActP